MCRSSCPVNYKDIAQLLVQFSETDLEPISKKYKINKVVGQFHSALEHTFVWVIDAEDPHLIEEFFIETELASFNNLKIIPLITFSEGVMPRVKKIHRL